MTELEVGIEARFEAYVEALSSVLGHSDRMRPLHDYCSGLLLPGERKSVEPMAALVAPDRVSAKHQSLLHFVGQASWSDARVLAKVRELVLPALEQSGGIEAWIVDDSGLPKKGMHSVGVARQYCGRLGKQDNCQVAVTLSVANHAASLPVAYQLYLPEAWAGDAARRAKVGVPGTVTFKTKPEIALDQIRTALADGIAPGVVLADVEWPEGEAEPTGYWLSTLPQDISLDALVDLAKLRWRIERDYQELKSELGLAHYEGRGWRGFHHHATLTIAAYGFLIRERAALPPSAATIRQIAAVPNRPRPRGAPDPTRTTPVKLHRDPAKAAHGRPGK